MGQPKDWTFAWFDDDHFLFLSHKFEKTADQNQKNLVAALLDYHNLNVFKKTFEPSAKVEGFGILFASCDFCLANKAAFNILRNHDDQQKTRQKS